MSRKWKIGPEGVHGGPNKEQLIGCTIARDSHTHEYLFLGPSEGELPLASVRMPVVFPFWFPKFKAELNGTARHDWYIRVDYVDGGIDFDRAHGRWRNTPPRESDDDEGNSAPTDTDTWTTSAGVGAEPEGGKKDKNKKTAASASAKR
jgi:hypothetical protein